MTPSPLSTNDHLFQQIVSIVGREAVHLSGSYYDECSTDATTIASTPLVVVAVNNGEYVAPLLSLARQHGVAIIARGAGTGYTGGAVAEQGGIVLSMSGLNRIIEIDTKNKVAYVEPGVITQVLADDAAEKGLFYPPDPASVKESSIGGNVAECAGGLRCKKYGLTKDYVLGIQAWDIEGKLIETGIFAEREDYDLGSILIGSEGTLAIITQIALQLIDPPTHRRTYFATFSQQADAAEVVSGIMAAGIIPAVLEFMDGDAIACTLDYLKWSDSIPAAAALLIELDGSAESVADQARLTVPIIQVKKPVQFEETDDAERRDYLWTLRRSISRAITAAAKLRISEDVCVPPSRLPELVGTLPGLAQRYALRVSSFGHAGDGNLHVNFLATEDNDETRKRMHNAVVELFKITVSMDGTISGEHGIGITKRDYLPIEVAPSTMGVFRSIKTAFDPDNLVNPGKIF